MYWGNQKKKKKKSAQISNQQTTQPSVLVLQWCFAKLQELQNHESCQPIIQHDITLTSKINNQSHRIIQCPDNVWLQNI